MLNLNQIKSLCTRYGFYPHKSLGQNFLIDQNIVKKIIQAANLTSADVVLEIGPGLGALTGELIKRAKKVIAVELDKKISAYLKAEFFERNKIEIIEGDILKVNREKIGFKNFGYKLVANLPYNITSYVLRNFLDYPPKPKEMILMVQEEVAQRIVAKPGQMSILAAAVQFYAESEILFKISKNSFWPRPQVDSAVIKIKLKERLPDIDTKRFFRLVRVGFSAKRKQLHNNLAAGLGLKNEEIKAIFRDLGWNEKVRAQDLNIEDWLNLVNKLKN